jgi:hypothetical protein
MKVALLIVGGVVVLPVAAVTLYGVVRTQKVEGDPRQTVFVSAHVPDAAIDGLHRGSLQGREVTWKGKKFRAADHTGINVFLTKTGGLEERYPFRTYVGKGIKDKKTDVLKIDYGQKSNPWWLRRIVDEVVETEPGVLLGKVHVKWVLGMTFTMGYFKLEKAPAEAPIGTAAPAPDESAPAPPEA